MLCSPYAAKQSAPPNGRWKGEAVDWRTLSLHLHSWWKWKQRIEFIKKFVCKQNEKQIKFNIFKYKYTNSVHNYV